MEKKKIQEKMMEAVRQVRETNPMAGSLTNYVTVNFVANAQLAVGGSAAMVYLPDEGEAIGLAGGATYINVGTLLPIHEESLPYTAKVLHEAGKPWVLDPVAVGIGDLRTKILKEMKPYKPSVIRGNASEIIALSKMWELESGNWKENHGRGVDSTAAVSEAESAAIALAKWTGGAVAVSGKEDLVTDGERIAISCGGSAFMEKVTGCGCSLGGVVAVYAAVTDPFTAALTATSIYNLAGSRAEKKAAGPGSFQMHFLDELYLASPEEVAENPWKLEMAAE
ncbi:MAG: hydroxyethylthiazole kinase [Clostridiales bacterium]|nr:hydroxyethylthiazole kinase [Clostridiales bacterium]